MSEFIHGLLNPFLAVWVVDIFIILLKIGFILLPLILSIAYLTLAERKVIGFMQVRIGPNRVGWRGSLQPIADVVKLLLKEVIVPTEANKLVFFIAPVIILAPALAAWAVIPFDQGLSLTQTNAALLYVLTLGALGVYGVILAGWGSNSKYALLGALRGAAHKIAYELAMGFALVGVLMASNTMNLEGIVIAQSGSMYHWYALPLLPLFFVYFISGVAETNRAPFDVTEGESEIVAGFHVEYSGMGFALFFLAEYANMILISALTAIMFLGGWLNPFQGLGVLETATAWVPGIVWFFAKVAFLLFLFLWFRATYPRYRYDQIMRLGWKIFIPITILWIYVEGVMQWFKIGPWFG